MKPSFVLVHSPKGIEEAKARFQDVEFSRNPPMAHRLPSFGRNLIKGLGSRLALTYLSNSLSNSLLGAASFPSSASDSSQGEAKMQEAPVSPKRIVVGLWSLDAWLGSLARMIEAINDAQRSFTFYEIQAAVPSGLISRPERMVSWLTEIYGEKLDDVTRQAIEDNLLANDFFGLADEVRKDLSLDYIIGLTPSMVAKEAADDQGRRTAIWNHFSTFDGSVILASNYQLHDFARSTGRPIGVFLLKVITSQLFVAMSWPKLGFHVEDRGCLFDYDASRTSLVGKVIDPKIEAECLVAPASESGHSQSVLLKPGAGTPLWKRGLAVKTPTFPAPAGTRHGP